MPTRQEHIAKAEGNVRFANSVLPTSPANIDWALIAMFYAGVHFVEAYLAELNQHIRSHATRDNFLGRERELRPIYREYGELKYFGFNARYEMQTFTANDISEARPALEKIEQHIKAAIEKRNQPRTHSASGGSGSV